MQLAAVFESDFYLAEAKSWLAEEAKEAPRGTPTKE
jgi:hypothetical protein